MLEAARRAHGVSHFSRIEPKLARERLVMTVEGTKKTGPFEPVSGSIRGG